MKKLSFVALALSLVVLPFLASAQGTPPTFGTDIAGNAVGADAGSAYSGIASTLTTISTWFLGILLILAIIFIVYAAFLYLTSGGDDEKVKSAKRALVYAVIAIAIGLLAKAIVYLVIALTQTGGTATP